MAPYCALVKAASMAFAADKVSTVDVSLFEEGKSLIDAIEAMNLHRSDDEAEQRLLTREMEFLRSYPASVLDDIRREIHDHLTQSPGQPMTFAWVETGTHECAPISLSRGKAITIGGPRHT